MLRPCSAPRVAVRATALALAALALPASATASSSSLYGGPGPRPGPRPGPDILYRKPATAPQLQNRGVWQAPPILVSGASAYRAGEFLYQDYIYDDHGARGTGRDPADPRTSADTFSSPNGTYTYPTGKGYLGNAVDLVELRTKPIPGATAFRITLNTLKKSSLVATTIALGNSSAPRDFPDGANASAPAKLFLTVHGHRAKLRKAKSGKRIDPAPTVHVSKRRNQINVVVPHRAWNPRRKTVRMAAGVGLWDKSAHQYLIPQTSADATHPGGARGLSNPTAFFNVAFRFDEPWPDITELSGLGAVADPSWWRDKHQGRALAGGDLSPFHAEVDFAKLRAGVHDDLRGRPGGVPRTGPMDRILSSHFHTGEGIDYANGCGNPDDCIGELRGRLQPYAIYVPKDPQPARGYGMTLLLHSLGASFNQFADSRNQLQFGERGPGSIVITPSGRGPDGWYYGHAGADTFEVWADVASHYDLDPARTAIAGYSMGGYGTYKFSTQFPDLFARAQPTVGPPGLGIWAPPLDPQPGGPGSNTNRMLASVRHIPFLIWDGTNDELVPVVGPLAQVQTFDDLGLRYPFDLFLPPVDHFALVVNDQFKPAADFLGTHRVDRSPNHVTYVVNPSMDFPKVGTVADHAYWLHGLRLRDDSGAASLGKIDALTHAFGPGEATPGATQDDLGTLTGGTFPALAFSEQSKGWGKAPNANHTDKLTLDLQNLTRVRVATGRAGLSCHPKFDVTTDGPATVVLDGCGRKVHFG